MSTMSRRGFLAVAGAASVMPGTPAAYAQPVANTARILVGFPPGGSTDVIARLLLPELKTYAASMIIENRPGAGGRVALEALKEAPPTARCSPSRRST